MTDYKLVPVEPTPEQIEPFARQWCISNGIDPDEPQPPHGEYPRWYGEAGPFAEMWKAISASMLSAAPEPVSDPYKIEPWKEGQEEGRLAERPWRKGDPKPSSGAMVLVSGAHADIESDKHRAFLWRRVVGHGFDGVDFICLQTKGCWPTVERLDSCWFAANPDQPLSNTHELAATVVSEPVAWVAKWGDGSVYGGPHHWPPSAREREYHEDQGRSISPLYTHPDPKLAMVGEALDSAGAWLDRWSIHAGSCKGGSLCTCGLTAIRHEVQQALAQIKGGE